MTAEKLKALLADSTIPQDAYSVLGNVEDEQYVLNRSASGWRVFYSERGVETSVREFEEESEACTYFLKWLRENPSFNV